ncbi:hypothetical protein [Streptomyces sp. NPDC026092]|uniref:hypothetical protein n=1 Tax=Streptomyces sp. NPDC026092 TaxID=3154797 RepID=UPI0033C8A3F9
MSSSRVSVALRATLLLVLALLCGTCVLPTSAAGPVVPQLQQPRVQQAASAVAYESAHAGGGEVDAPRGSVLPRDRRRAVTAPVGPPGPPPLVARTSPPLTHPSAGGPDTRPRPLAAHEPSALQVFLC